MLNIVKKLVWLEYLHLFVPLVAMVALIVNVTLASAVVEIKIIVNSTNRFETTLRYKITLIIQ